MKKRERGRTDPYLHPADREDAEQRGQRQHPLHPRLPLPGPPTIPRFSMESARSEGTSANSPAAGSLSRRGRDVRRLIRRMPEQNGRLGPYMCGFDMRRARYTRHDATESAAYYCCPPSLGGSLARRESKMAARVGRYAAPPRRQPAGQSRRGRPFTGAFTCAPRSVDNVAGTPRVQTARGAARRGALTAAARLSRFD